MTMNIKNYLGVMLALSACAAPTTSIDLESEQLLSKENFLFYIPLIHLRKIRNSMTSNHGDC